MRRSKGFTLIELLVVIAIIGILASMVFPVFARARESARKAVCLSNVKNIALAIQMYLADNNDVLFPAEHRQEVHNYFEAYGGPDCWSNRGYFANPYLRVPVILDEYVKNRDVWNCPSARLEFGATWIIGYPDWLQYLKDTEGAWGDGSPGGGPCRIGYPSGWGGEVTDSIAQQRLAIARAEGEGPVHGAFTQSIAVNKVDGLKLVEVEDPVSRPETATA